jgi:hypothetical protein
VIFLTWTLLFVCVLAAIVGVAHALAPRAFDYLLDLVLR